MRLRLLGALLCAGILAASQTDAQDRLVPGKVPSQVGATLAVTCVDPGSGAANACGGPSTAVSTDASTTVTLGGTYQTVFASSTTRKGCLIQNPTTATEVLNVRVKGTAVFTVPAGATFACASSGGLVISDLIEVTAATTSHAFTAVSQ